MKKLLSILLTVLMLGFVAAPLSAQNTLTVADGTETNGYVPFYGYYMDSEEHTQIIFPDSMLADMQGYAITQMEFYLSSNPSFTSTITISLGISTNSSFSGETFDNETTLTEVYSGAIVIANNVMTVEFDSPFNYSGGNLLFDLTNTSGNYTSASFYGITSTGASLNDYSYNWGSVQKNFIPKTTFSYGTPSLCSKPTGLTVTAITTNSATISWLGSDNASSYNVEYMLSTESDWANAQSITAYDTTVDLSGLNPSSSYKVRVQTVCSDNTETNWSSVKNFLTSCDAITITDSWFEDFEGYTGSGEQPFNCWATPVTTPGGGPFVYCGYGQSCHSGVNSAELKGYTNMLVLPEFTNDLHTLRMTFWATNYGSGTSAVVGVITDISDTSTFEVLGDAGTPGPRGSANAGNGNLMGPFDFNSVEATTGRIAILFNGPGTSSGWNLDDFTVTFIPACAEPTGLANVNVAATSADLTWNEVDGSTYDLVYWENGGEDTTTSIPLPATLGMCAQTAATALTPFLSPSFHSPRLVSLWSCLTHALSRKARTILSRSSLSKALATINGLLALPPSILMLTIRLRKDIPYIFPMTTVQPTITAPQTLHTHTPSSMSLSMNRWNITSLSTTRQWAKVVPTPFMTICLYI